MSASNYFPAWDIILLGVILYFNDVFLRRKDCFFSAVCSTLAIIWLAVIWAWFFEVLR